MKKVLSYLFVILFLSSGLILVVYGYSLKSQVQEIEPHGRLWIEGENIIPPGGKRLTWGVKVEPEKMPQYLMFHIMCSSNTSIFVKAYWDDPDRIMLTLFGDDVDETVFIQLTDQIHQQKWTLYLDNTGERTASINNFTVIYQGILKPNEMKGKNLMYLGGALVSISSIVLIVFRKKR